MPPADGQSWWWDSTYAPQEPDASREAIERLLRDLEVEASPTPDG